MILNVRCDLTEVLKDNCAVLDKRVVFIFRFRWCHSAGFCCLFCVREVELGSGGGGNCLLSLQSSDRQSERNVSHANFRLRSTLWRKIKWSKAQEDEWRGVMEKVRIIRWLGVEMHHDSRWNTGKSKRIVLRSNSGLRWKRKDAGKQGSWRKSQRKAEWKIFAPVNRTTLGPTWSLAG